MTVNKILQLDRLTKNEHRRILNVWEPQDISKIVSNLAGLSKLEQ